MAESAMPVIGDYFNLQTIKEETKQLPEKNKFALEAQKGKTEQLSLCLKFSIAALVILSITVLIAIYMFVSNRPQADVHHHHHHGAL